MQKNFFKNRPLSWSQLSSFQYSPEQWHRKYVLNEKPEENEAMRFGKKIGERLASDPTFLPEVKRYPVFEKKLLGHIGNIDMIGFLDSFDPETKHFLEYKTSHNKNKWTQKSAGEHGQLLMYKFLIWVNYQIPPEDIKSTLWYIPVEETGSFELVLSKEPVQFFEVKHSSVDVLNFATLIKKTVKEMELFCKQMLLAKPLPMTSLYKEVEKRR